MLENLKNLNWKKIGLVLIFVVFMVAFALGLYFLFFKQVLAPEVVTNANINGEQRLPGTANGNATVVNINSIINSGLPLLANVNGADISDVARGGLTFADKLDAGAALGDSMVMIGGEVYYYNRLDGKFYRLNESGNKTLLDNTTFYNADQVTWSPLGDKAIIEYPDQTNILYNFTTDEQITLPKELSDFSFNKNGTQISSELVTENEGSNWLITANPNGSGITYIEPLGDKASEVETGWSADNQIVAIYRESVDFEKQEIFPLGQNNENFPSLIVNGRGYEGSWSPNTNSLLYSVYNKESGYRPTLYLSKTGPSGTSAVYDTGLYTWSDKCAFAGTNAYCAAPINMPEYSGLYRELGENTAYTFYEIDLDTGNSQMLAIPVGANGQFFGVDNLVVSQNEDILYFTDSLTGEIYSLQLK